MIALPVENKKKYFALSPSFASQFCHISIQAKNQDTSKMDGINFRKQKLQNSHTRATLESLHFFSFPFTGNFL